MLLGLLRPADPGVKPAQSSIYISTCAGVSELSMPSLGRRTLTGDLADVEAEGSCAAVVKVVNAEIVVDTLIGDEEVDDENPLAAIMDDAPAVSGETAAAGTEAPPSKSIAASPHFVAPQHHLI